MNKKAEKEFKALYEPAKKKTVSMFWLIMGLILYSCFFRLKGNYRIIGFAGIFIISYFWNREIIK